VCVLTAKLLLRLQFTHTHTHTQIEGEIRAAWAYPHLSQFSARSYEK
jgi:hypothetical protein